MEFGIYQARDEAALGGLAVKKDHIMQQPNHSPTKRRRISRPNREYRVLCSIIVQDRIGQQGSGFDGMREASSKLP